jgi:hypothetical protein
MNDPRVYVLLIAVVSLLLIAATWSVVKLRLRYVIGQKALRVMLGGLTLRRIGFDDIRRISTPHSDPDWSKSENWRNTFRGTHRLLVIQRKSGRFRKFVVTPRLRYEFREQLRTAIARANGIAPKIDDDDGTDA